MKRSIGKAFPHYWFYLYFNWRCSCKNVRPRFRTDFWNIFHHDIQKVVSFYPFFTSSQKIPKLFVHKAFLDFIKSWSSGTWPLVLIYQMLDKGEGREWDAAVSWTSRAAGLRHPSITTQMKQDLNFTHGKVFFQEIKRQQQKRFLIPPMCSFEFPLQSSSDLF